MNKRISITAVIVALATLLASPGAFADKGGKGGQGRHERHDDDHRYEQRHEDRRYDDGRHEWRSEQPIYDDRRGDISIRAYFGNSDRRIVDEYYAPQFRSGHCPPGLAKKGNGCMPPGQAKKWRQGYPLPQGLVYYDLPPDLIYRMPPPPRGHRYVRVGPDILLLSIGSGIVIDAMIDIGR
ncbi:MAG: RcnB family protein [Betaproteobacteria bacterium]|nr:RcnB family protein [Betaproteobacteria bacterium]